MPKVSMDKKYRTRDGRKVEIFAVDMTDCPLLPVIGVIEEPNRKIPSRWNEDGDYGYASSCDLIEIIDTKIPEEYTAWYGGEVSPVPLTHAFYFIRRDGQIFLGRAGGFYRWTHENLDNDIIGYKIIEPETTESDEPKLEEKIEKVIDRILNVMDERCGNLSGSELNEMAKAIQTLQYLTVE
jgi:hypothetical protein